MVIVSNPAIKPTKIMAIAGIVYRAPTNFLVDNFLDILVFTSKFKNTILIYCIMIYFINTSIYNFCAKMTI